MWKRLKTLFDRTGRECFVGCIGDYVETFDGYFGIIKKERAMYGTICLKIAYLDHFDNIYDWYDYRQVLVIPKDEVNLTNQDII